MSFVGMFVSLHDFVRKSMMLDDKGIKIIIEVDGAAETEHFVREVHSEHFVTQRTGISQSRSGTMMGIPFVIRTSPRCSKCHK